MERTLQTTLLVLLFALSFMSVGWLAPAMYAAYGPSDEYMTVHSFEANNASIGQVDHVACFERTASVDTTGIVFTELTLIGESGDRIQVLSKTDERFVQQGHSTVKVRTDIPESINPGVYRYERAYEVSLANGRVIRTFSFESEKFTIKENANSGPVC